MRRAILALTGMVAGTTLLISVKSAPGASRLPAQVEADQVAAARAAALASASASPGLGLGLPVSPGPSAEADVPAVPAPGTSVAAAPGRTSGPAPGATTKPPVVAPKSTTTTKPPNAPTVPGTFTGDSSYTEFGYVTVAITVSGGKITQVTPVELPSNEPRSVSISAKAEPVLRQRALAAQNSKIDSVSGATYTSEAYKSSLQSAIDKAGLA